MIEQSTGAMMSGSPMRLKWRKRTGSVDAIPQHLVKEVGRRHSDVGRCHSSCMELSTSSPHGPPQGAPMRSSSLSDPTASPLMTVNPKMPFAFAATTCPTAFREDISRRITGRWGMHPFEQRDTEEHIVTEVLPGGKERITAGTIVKIVERLTQNRLGDPDTLENFLLTYRALMSPCDLLGLVLRRFEDGVAGVHEASGEGRAALKWSTICHSTVDFMKCWLMRAFENDFHNDQDMRFILVLFINTALQYNREVGSSLCRVVDMCRIDISLHMQRGRITAHKPKQMSGCVLVNGLMKEFANRKHLGYTDDSADVLRRTFLAMNMNEFAEYLTYTDAELFRNVKVVELSSQNWTKDPAAAPSIAKVVKMFNSQCMMYKTVILACSKLDERIEVMGKLVWLGKRLTELQNLSGLMAIMSAFASAPIIRLTESLKGKPRKACVRPHSSPSPLARVGLKMLFTDSIKASLSKLTDIHSPDQNYRVYRNTLRAAEGAVVPYLGLYLSDLTFSNDGNKNRNSLGLVNFRKLQLVAMQMHNLLNHQNRCVFTELENAQHMFDDVLDTMDAFALCDKGLYAKSLVLEPTMKPPMLEKRNSFLGSLGR